MRSDLAALVNAPPVSNGHELQNKLMVLAWLYLLKFCPNVQFNTPNNVAKVTAMQGVTPDNMIDLQIQGLATKLGYGTTPWPVLAATAKAAIDGPGFTPTGGISQAITSGDYQTLINWALLTNAGILNDGN